MPSILNATTTNGLVTSADNSGSLQLQTNNGTTAVTIDTSQRAAFVAGTAALPAITTSGDTNTGMFFPAADTIAFAEGGTETMRLDSSGNVSIGTTTPGYLGNPADLCQIAVNRLPSSGVITNSARSAAFINLDGSSGGSSIQFATAAANNTNPTERMRITSGGDIYCGQSSYTFGVNPTTGTDIVAGGLIINATRRTTGASGNTLWDSAGVFYRSTSSLKYKRDVETMQYGLNEVMSLRPVTFSSKSEVDGDNRFGGFIAEEVDALGLKEFVSYDQENAPDGLQYANMVALLTKAIQELKAELDATKAEVQALKGVA